MISTLRFSYNEEKILTKIVNKQQSKLEIIRDVDGTDKFVLDQREIFVINGIDENNMLTSCYHPGSTGKQKFCCTMVIYVSFIPFFVFGHFWQRSLQKYENIT